MGPAAVVVAITRLLAWAIPIICSATEEMEPA